MEDKVNFCITTYKNVDLLMGAIESLRKTVPQGLDYSIIVINDDPEEALRIKGVEVINNLVNKGYTKNVNTFLREYLTNQTYIFNDDLVVRPGWYEAMLKAQENKDYGLIGFLDEGKYSKYGYMFSAFWINPELVKKIGLLDERMIFHCSDAEYSYRVATKSDYKLVFLSSKYWLHKGFQATSKFQNFVEIDKLDNAVWRTFIEADPKLDAKVAARRIERVDL
jgi:GT2 family glycosyltransferase